MKTRRMDTLTYADRSHLDLRGSIPRPAVRGSGLVLSTVALVGLIAAASCDSDSAVSPDEGPLYFAGTVYDLENDLPVMAFEGEPGGLGWGFAPDPDRPFFGVPEGVPTSVIFNSRTSLTGEGGYAEFWLTTHGIPVPPGPGTFQAGDPEDPMDPASFGIFHGRFNLNERFPSLWGDLPARYRVVDGTFVVEEITPDGPAAGTLSLVGEAREAYADWPARVRLEGTFRSHKLLPSGCPGTGC